MRSILLSFPLMTALALSTIASGCIGGGLQVGDDDDDDDGDTGDDDDDDEPIDTGFPAPKTDITDAIGSAETLEVGAWNLKNFPCGNASFSTECVGVPANKPSLLADAITSMQLDLLAIEEIADEDAFNETVQRLPFHESRISSDTYSDGSYQKIGFIYDATVLDAGEEALLFTGDFNFPRPALQVRFTHKETGLVFLAVAVHLKAGETDEDFERRRDAIARMEDYARNLVDGAGEDHIVFLGDFNETLTDSAGLESFAPFRDGQRYDIRTEVNAAQDESSFLPSGVILDHIVTTAALDDEAGSAAAIIPRLDVDISNYRNSLSDHLPVILRLTP